jgi:hypothetical protein
MTGPMRRCGDHPSYVSVLADAIGMMAAAGIAREAAASVELDRDQTHTIDDSYVVEEAPTPNKDGESLDEILAVETARIGRLAERGITTTSPHRPTGALSRAIDAAVALEQETARQDELLDAVRTHIQDVEHRALQWDEPLPVPGWTRDLRRILDWPGQGCGCPRCEGASERAAARGETIAEILGHLPEAEH